MSTTPDTSGGICWCEMCGYTATLTPAQRAKFKETEAKRGLTWCPLCDEVGAETALCHDDELPEHMAPDDPTPAYEG